MPTLAVTRTASLPIMTGSSSTVAMRRATRAGAALSSTFSISNANSSPPSRATVSDSRAQPRSLRATSHSSWSPTS